MTKAPAWQRLGPFLLRSEQIQGTDALPRCEALVTVTGWESRNLAVTTFSASFKTIRVFDFAPFAGVGSVMQQQSAALGSAFGFQRDSLVKLKSSTEVRENLHEMKVRLRALHNGGIRSLFVDISSMPKAYIQSLVGWIFTEGVFPRVVFGYAEGDYSDADGSVAAEASALTFEVAKPLLGNVACREKNLIIVLGGERANCYALIEQVGPDRLYVFATKSDNHPKLLTGIQSQLEKLNAEYGDRLKMIEWVEAFSVHDLWEKTERALKSIASDEATTFFASGTKPHAMAAALAGCAYSNQLEVRYRRLPMYSASEVAWAGRYFVYEVLDLRSEKLVDCDIEWVG